MSNQAVFEYLRSIVGRYALASKKEKSKILDHAKLATRLSRKQLIRRLRAIAEDPQARCRSGRPKKFPPELLIPHIRFLWVSMERISSRRMKAALPEWLRFYHENAVTPEVKRLLLQMSASTLERFLKVIRNDVQFKKGLSTTSPARYMKNKIPLNTLDQKIHKPGHVQADTVAHCGTTTAGIYNNSLTVTDIYSGWTENRALYGKKGVRIKNQFIDIENTLPFYLCAVNTDSGSEFLNNALATHFWNRLGPRIEFTRSRPYKKNDNAYVEQKNFTHVRELFGYERLEAEELVDHMNRIYKQYWNPLQNFFIPNFKLLKKERVGAKIKKKFDRPKTPYERLMGSLTLTAQQKKELQDRKLSLNPFELKKGLEAELQVFFNYVRKLSNQRNAS